MNSSAETTFEFTHHQSNSEAVGLSNAADLGNEENQLSGIDMVKQTFTNDVYIQEDNGEHSHIETPVKQGHFEEQESLRYDLFKLSKSSSAKKQLQQQQQQKYHTPIPSVVGASKIPKLLSSVVRKDHLKAGGLKNDLAVEDKENKNVRQLLQDVSSAAVETKLIDDEIEKLKKEIEQLRKDLVFKSEETSSGVAVAAESGKSFGYGWITLLSIVLLMEILIVLGIFSYFEQTEWQRELSLKGLRYFVEDVPMLWESGQSAFRPI
ncbi:hypothetical protein MP638_005283 [Amoeboaphelidium occidentale]|nr:hypothetical protein MP638_005283 [Amoeboaphelidium occidentale]